MATALFVCLHNAGRSQMSAALFERAARGRHRALSAGSEADPAGNVHPEVVTVMRELGVDLAGARPKRLSDELVAAADVVVTMGCGDACPFLPGKRYVDWEVEDPKGRPVDDVRATRDDLARRVDALLAELDAGPDRMGAGLPIACSLGAAELEGRLDELRALGREALLTARSEPRHTRLSFAAVGDVPERLEAVVAAESRCCAFLTLRLARDGDALVLDLEAPEGAEPVLAELVGAFSGR